MGRNGAAISVTGPEYPTRARGTILDRAYHASRAACATRLSLAGDGSETDLSRGIVRPVAVDGDGPGLVCEAVETGQRIGLVGPSVTAALRAADENQTWTGSGWLLDPSGRVQQPFVVEETASACGFRVGPESGRSVVVVLPSDVVAVLQRELRALGASEWAGATRCTSGRTSFPTHDAA